MTSPPFKVVVTGMPVVARNVSRSCAADVVGTDVVPTGATAQLIAAGVVEVAAARSWRRLNDGERDQSRSYQGGERQSHGQPESRSGGHGEPTLPR